MAFSESNRQEPFVPASTALPEITFRALVLGIVLAVILAASTTYIGLKIARTIAASIPAALISMLVLRRFRNANILENNMVQTIASAGEVVAAGVIFTLPALIIMGYWQSFDYFQTALITIIGGILGVLFSVPLRRTMIVKDNLPYPEGIATGEVLKAGEDTNKGSARVLLFSSVFSGFFAFLQTGLKVIGEQVQYWTQLGYTAIGGSLMLSPALMGAGYIVGIRGLVSFIVGGILTWGIAMPFYVATHGLPEGQEVGSALAVIHKSHFRYVGVGVLAVGGLWSVISLMNQIVSAFKSSFAAMKSHRSEFDSTLRTDRDLPFQYVIIGVLLLVIPTFFLFFTMVKDANFNVGDQIFWITVIFATVFALIVSFVAAAIAAYIVGVVGTTSLPISGITIAAIIAFSSFLLLLLSPHIDFSVNTDLALKAAALVIIFAAVVCVAAAVSGDNMQDLKAGQLVGATPWKQQLMLAVGVVASALVIPFILQTTFLAYGIADVLPRPDMNPQHALPAPQAALMATIPKGFFDGKLPWNMILGGAGLSVIAIILDVMLKRLNSSVRFPVMLFALGIYLPFGYITAFCVGGVIQALVEIWNKSPTSETSQGILCASGIIAGEAIVGAILTIFFAYKSTEVFALKIEGLASFDALMGFLLYLGLAAYLYKQGKNKKG